MTPSTDRTDWYNALLAACDCGDIGLTNALSFAVENDHGEVIEWLFSNEMVSYIPSTASQLLLHTATTALQSNNQEVLDNLLNSSVYELFFSKAEQQSVLNGLLADAVRKEDCDMINLMVALGAQVNAEDRQPLLGCAGSFGGEIDLLVENGMFTVGESVPANYFSWGPVYVLSEHGVDWGWSHQPLLHEAIQYHNSSTIEALLQETVVDLDARDGDNRAALLVLASELWDMHACDGRKGDMIDKMKVLIQFGADVNAKAGQGEAALDLMIHTVHSDLVEMLLKAGAWTDEIGSSFPLSGVVPWCQTRNLALLLQHGCDPHRLDKRGSSLYDRLMGVTWGNAFVEEYPHLFFQAHSDATNPRSS